MGKQCQLLKVLVGILIQLNPYSFLCSRGGIIPNASPFFLFISVYCLKYTFRIVFVRDRSRNHNPAPVLDIDAVRRKNEHALCT